MRHQSIFALWLFSLGSRYLVRGDNIRKPNLRTSNHNVNDLSDVASSTGFANFHPVLDQRSGNSRLGNGRKTREEDDQLDAKDYTGMRVSIQPRTRRELESGHLASIQPPRSRRKVEVRNLSFQRCGNGGTQYVVQCMAGTEEHCYKELRKANAVIVNELPNSDFFAVCVDTEEEKELLKTLTDVVDMEEDYVRTLSYLPELTKPVDRRKLQSQGQMTPYGVTMINAPQFWQSKGDKGGSAKVCIIDTGLFVGHEDMQGATVSGSTSNDVVADWDSDDAGHGMHMAEDDSAVAVWRLPKFLTRSLRNVCDIGTHVGGTIAAVDNNVGVVGVAPEAELLIVRGRSQFLKYACYTISSDSYLSCFVSLPNLQCFKGLVLSLLPVASLLQWMNVVAVEQTSSICHWAVRAVVWLSETRLISSSTKASNSSQLQATVGIQAIPSNTLQVTIK
jgi:Subtilase family